MSGSVNDADGSQAMAVFRRPAAPLLHSARLALAVWGLFGFFNMYALRVNLSVAIVEMVNSTANHKNSSVDATCPVDSPSNITPAKDISEGEFNWEPWKQSIILGSFFYGYIVTQIPGGILATKFGGKSIFGLGALCTSLFTLLTPLAAKIDWKALVAVRIVEGLGEGVTFPAMTAMFSKWAPPLERSRLSTIAFSGAQVGTIIGLPLAGLLCRYVSWDSVFYLYGTAGIIWFVLWMVFVSDSPEQHKRISGEEREYIVTMLEKERGGQAGVSTPWCHIWASPSLWAIVMAHTAQNWFFYTLLTETPTFLSQILHFDIKQNGFLSALPYLLQWILIILSGLLADFMIQKKFSVTVVRKFMATWGYGLPALCLIMLAYVGCNKVLAVCLLVGATGFSGFNYSSYNCNHLDIAPQYAGILMGISNCFATIPGFAGPAVVGLFAENDFVTLLGWQHVFIISGCVAAFGLVFYLIFGTGQVQPWAKVPPDLSGPCCFNQGPERQRLLEN